GLVYDDRIMTLQAHPEFNLSYENQLITLRKGEVIPDETAELGLATVNEKDAQIDSVMVAHWMADFLNQRAPKS
ncbi:glutamine amidotransferase, partial [Oceanospirillum sp. HFRX-1_2]